MPLCYPSYARLRNNVHMWRDEWTKRKKLFWIMGDAVAWCVHMYRPLGFERISGFERVLGFETNIHNLIHHRIFVSIPLIGVIVMSLLFTVCRLGG